MIKTLSFEFAVIKMMIIILMTIKLLYNSENDNNNGKNNYNVICSDVLTWKEGSVWNYIHQID